MKAELLTEDIQEKIGKNLQSFQNIYRSNKKSSIRKIFWVMAPCAIIILFLPWTQNIKSEGDVTTRLQEERPQQINSTIPGKITKWFIKEGDYVQKGDTILQLAEIKDDYLDPNLLNRTQQQVQAEMQSIQSYKSKSESYFQQIKALEAERQFKLKTIENKIQQTVRKINSDSFKVTASKNELIIAERQIDAAVKMYKQGVIPLTEFERRKIVFQNAEAKYIATVNDFNNIKQDIMILQLDKNGLVQNYLEKIAKSESEIFQSQSQIASAEGKMAKLENQYENYKIRSGQYFVIAPQSGQIINAKKGGLLETVKEAEMLAEIVPTSSLKAAEVWIDAMDLQLVGVGQEVRLIFDGFPAIVFSGWPSQSYGTFTGEIAAIETNVSANNKFRILITEKRKEKPWPKELKLGCGVKVFAMLKNVPIWYELWRQVNGFPPDFYKQNTSTKPTSKK